MVLGLVPKLLIASHRTRHAYQQLCPPYAACQPHHLPRHLLDHQHVHPHQRVHHLLHP
jgi:hypothetical protein